MRIHGLTVVGVLAACVLIADNATAADLPIQPTTSAPAAPASASADTRQNDLEGADAACREWTDGCRVCARAEDNKFACSNPGIACQPAQGRCTRR